MEHGLVFVLPSFSKRLPLRYMCMHMTGGGKNGLELEGFPPPVVSAEVLLRVGSSLVLDGAESAFFEILSRRKTGDLFQAAKAGQQVKTDQSHDATIN